MNINVKKESKHQTISFRFRIFRTFRSSYVIVFATALLLVGFGCKGLSAQQQAAVSPVTLNYWTVYDNVDQLQAFAQEYARLHPQVTINVRQLRYEEFDSIFTNALAEDVGPDIISLHTRWLRKYENRIVPMPKSVSVAREEVVGQLQPETVVTVDTNYMPTSNDIRRDYLSTVVDDITDAGQIYGLPLTIDAMAIYYNKDLLDKAGIATPPKTWDEFSADVTKATTFDSKGAIVQSGAALGTGNNIDNAFDILSLLMMQNGVTMATGNRVAFADGIQNGVAGHPAIESLRFYTDFARPEKKVYAWNDAKGKAIDEFARGHVVFYIGFAYDYPRIRAKGPLLNVAVIPIPQLNPQSPANVASYWMQSVVKKSRHQDEAWDFIRFISDPARIKKYAQALAEPSPMRVHVADEINDPILGPFAIQSLNSKNWYRGRDVDAASHALQDLITGYLQPVPDGKDSNERDARLLQTAAEVVQQTM